MHVFSALSAVFAALVSLAFVSSREVFAHYMVGSVSKAHAEQDIDVAKAAGISGFSLNIGTPSKDFVVPTLNFLFDHAASVGGFHLHISMDVWASGDAAGGHPDLYNDVVRGFVGKPAYFKVNGKPYLTTFSDGGLRVEDWKAWKLNTLANNLYFCPDFDGTAGYTTGADGWWYYWGDTVDCVFSWDTAWQSRGTDPKTGKPYAGSLSAGSIEIDQAVINSATRRNKGYNMGFSELQYKNAYNTNVYRNGGMMTRMVNMLTMSPRPDFATALTWNDGPESHYIGPIWSEQNTDTDPARYVTADNMWSHAAWRPIIAAFADAFISGGGVSSMTPHASPENVVGAMWYKTIMQGSICASGDHPGGWEKGTDDLHWGLVLKPGRDTSNYRLYLISGGTTALHIGFHDGLNYGTIPVSPGKQCLELYDGVRLIYEAKGGRDVHSDCPDGIFNMNVVTASVLPPKLVEETGWCTFHFTQYQKPHPASDPYTFSLTLFEPTGHKIGGVTKAIGRPNEPILVSSTLSSSLAIFAGNVDGDPITFAHETQTWTSSSPQCKTGRYDSGHRDGDCGFTCSLPPGSPCTDRLALAAAVADRLTSRYISPKLCTDEVCGRGYFIGDQAWENANAYEDIINYMDVANQQGHQRDLDDTSIPSDLLRYQDKSDDAGWAVLMYIRLDAYYGLAGTGSWQAEEDYLYTYMERFKDGKDGECGAGVFWDSGRGFKATISNALYMHASAALAVRRPKDSATYFAKAVDTWTWLVGSGIRNSDNIWLDGIHMGGGCKPDGADYLYAQGVIVAGLGFMYSASRDVNYLTEAEKTIDGVIATRTTNGILRENQCDAKNSCDTNQQMFKGIFLKHLMYYLDQANDSARAAKYASFIAAQSDAVKNFATNSDGDPGSLWYMAPSSSLGTKVSSWSVASGLTAHYVAAKYGACRSTQ